MYEIRYTLDYAPAWQRQLGEEPPADRKYPRMADIIKAVAEYYHVREIDLMSFNRQREIVQYRQVAMWLGRALTLMSLPRIGKVLANRDHTTILHGCRKIEALRQTDPGLQSDLDQLTSQLRRN